MTSLPAQKFHLKDRGLLKEGYAADILVFNDQEVQDMSTFEKPHQYTKGFKYVLINGMVAIDDGIQNQLRNGKTLRLID
jgi:N-acyl-D-amino-acid deacylase